MIWPNNDIKKTIPSRVGIMSIDYDAWVAQSFWGVVPTVKRVQLCWFGFCWKTL